MIVLDRLGWRGADATEGVCICHNRNYRADGTKYPVVMLHPRGGNHMTTMPVDGVLYPPVVSLIDSGYSVFEIDGGGPTNGLTNWGNDTSITCITDVIAYAVANWGAKSGGVYLLGMSMGTVSGLNWAARNASLVKACAFGYPAVDLSDLHANVTFTTEIETAYGGGAGYTAALATHSPLPQASSLTTVPQLFYTSSNDTVCVPARHAAYVAAVGATATSRDMGAVGHGNWALVPGQPVTDFFASHP